MNGATLFAALVIILVTSSPLPPINCQSNGNGKWQSLTKHNFSSQIRLHQHILLLVSVPWSGEFRSLMKEISHLVSDIEEEEEVFGSLKLMYMHRNKEKVLADAIGATEGLTILYYLHALPYKYQGKFVARNIVFSILPYLSVSPEEIPIKALNTLEELTLFLESTDKALLLLEFCGWTPRLLARNKRNGTENGSFAGDGFNGESDGIAVPSGKENQKGMETASLKCEIHDEFSGIPWIGEFRSVNSSCPLQDTEDVEPSVGSSSCTYEEFQQFDSFFSGYMNAAREFFLPSERFRFGLVSERSLLSFLGIGDSVSWSAMLYSNGCPSCSKILKEEDDLKTVLLMDELVTELDGNGQHLDPAVPANKPSVLLFVDRFSNSLETKRRSKEALDALRKLALQFQISDQISQQNGDKPDRASVQGFLEYRSISGHPRLKLSPMAQKIKLKEKMSIMIVNEGKQAILENLASDLQGSSLHEILTDLLEKKKEAKLSSVAKEVGFQLLSNDIDIKLTDKLLSEPQLESTEVSVVPSEEGVARTSVDLDTDSAQNQDKSSQNTDIQSLSQDDEQKRIYVDTSANILSVNSDQLVTDDGLAISGMMEEEKGSTQMNQLEEEYLHCQSFNGSFFFSDGNYRLLRSLTGETRIPSLVIIDPILQQHYVFPEEMIFSFSSLEGFLHGFLDGILIPYQRSQSEHKNPIEGNHPPFINKDFHEADSIPQITSQSFSEMVLGFNQSDSDNIVNAWKEDVLVLFSNSWCGFCQRMELVVREVYRAIKGYVNMLKARSRNGETVLSDDNLKNGILKLPKIYLMDCALNDCNLILKSRNQREVYPSLLLFPAERKTAVSYEGVMAVADVIKFIADYGSSSQHLASEKGILWSVAEKSGRNHFKPALPTTVREESSVEDKSHEILLKNRTPKRAVEYSQIKIQTPKQLEETAPHVVVGSVLFATDKLNAQPFDKSMVLIVKADQNTGFQGLIYNKLIRWESLEELEQGLELLKEAPLSFGGPLIKRGMPLVALTRRVVKDQYPEVVPGVYFLDQLATLREIEELKSGNQSVADYWFFLGFSSWGWKQLFDEIADGAWYVSVNSTGHLEWP